MTRILFVCLGNICRSPAAEAVTRAKALSEGLDVTLDSAGTAEWHSGNPPYAPMQAAARPRGYQMSDLRARQASPQDFIKFDLIIGMDAQNISDLKSIAQTHSSAKLALFTDYAPQTGEIAVPDPYYTHDYDGALALIETCADGLIQNLKNLP